MIQQILLNQAPHLERPRLGPVTDGSGCKDGLSGEKNGAHRTVSHLHGCLRTGDRILEGFGLQQAHQFSG